MPGTLNVTCAGCKAKYQVPPVLAGKKIRCKKCNAAIAVPGAAKPVPASKKAAATAAPAVTGEPAAAPASNNEEWGAISAYGMIKESDKPRCPHCAEEMDEEEIVCLNCGYNTITREHLPNKILEPVTGGDIFIWLLPGIASLVGALIGIFFLQAIFTHTPNMGFFEWAHFSIENKAIPTYFAIFLLCDIWVAGYFAFRRLVLNPMPPERIKHIEKSQEDD